MNEMYDVTIIGGGTTGLYTAFYSGMRDMKTKVMEYQNHLGGKVSYFYPEKKIYDVGGFPGVTGDELVEKVEEQAKMTDPTIVTGEKITAVEKQPGGTFALVNEKGEKHLTKTVIIASGMGTFEMQPFRVKNSERFADNHIHYTIQHLNQYKEKKMAVLSGSRVGIDWALALEKLGTEVHLINAGDTFKAVYDHDIEKLEQSKVSVYKNKKVEELHGEGSRLTGLTLNSGKIIDVDHILVYEGLTIEKSLYDQWGLDTEKGRIPVGTDMCTNIEGIYVAGDAAIYPSKTMLIASGFNEAMAAVNSAAKYLNPKASSQVYSTVIYKHQ